MIMRVGVLCAVCTPIMVCVVFQSLSTTLLSPPSLTLCPCSPARCWSARGKI